MKHGQERIYYHVYYVDSILGIDGRYRSNYKQMKGESMFFELKLAIAITELLEISVKHLSLVMEVMRKQGMPEELLIDTVNALAEEYNEKFGKMSLTELHEYMERSE